MFCKGDRFTLMKNQLRETERNFWTGYGHVMLEPDETALVLKAESVLRKALLFNVGESMVVADYQRKRKCMHYKVLIPPLIETNDMIVVQGENINDHWHAKVCDINHDQKKATVVFFVQSKREPGVYVRESLRRDAKNVISWKSVIAVASGQWMTKSTWRKT